VAEGASGCPSGVAGKVDWIGVQAGAELTVRLPGGGREHSFSGEQAVQPGQHVGAGSTGEGRKARGAQVAMEARGARFSSATAIAAAAGLGVLSEEQTGLAFIGD
jgi:hypothetical protein